MTSYEFQQRLFHVLKDRYGEKLWISKLSEVLSISTGALYKKIRGEVHLSLDELLRIKEHFQISLDGISQTLGEVAFKYNSDNKNVESYFSFLSGILNDILKVATLPKVRVLYASGEIPLFHYLSYPSLISFKLVIWTKTSWEFKEIQNMDEEIHLLKKDPDVMRLIKSLDENYSMIPSTEIWSINMLDNTLNQIRYYWQSGILNDKKLVIEIIDNLSMMITDNLKMLTKGKKIKQEAAEGAELKVYLNEIIHTNNVILVESALANFAYLTHDNPNFIKTSDPGFCEYTASWFHKIIKRSQQISVESEKQRLIYKGIMEAKVQVLRSEILK